MEHPLPTGSRLRRTHILTAGVLFLGIPLVVVTCQVSMNALFNERLRDSIPENDSYRVSATSAWEAFNLVHATVKQLESEFARAPVWPEVFTRIEASGKRDLMIDPVCGAPFLLNPNLALWLSNIGPGGREPEVAVIAPCSIPLPDHPRGSVRAANIFDDGHGRFSRIWGSAPLPSWVAHAVAIDP